MAGIGALQWSTDFHRIRFLSLNKTKPGSRLSLWIEVSQLQYGEVFKHSGFVSLVPTNSLPSVRPGTWITFAECWLCARHGCGSFHLFLMTILLSRHYLSSAFFAEQKTDWETFGNMLRIAWLVRGKAGTQTYICVVLKPRPSIITPQHLSTDIELPWPNLRRWIYEIFKGFLPSLSPDHIHLPTDLPHSVPIPPDPFSGDSQNQEIKMYSVIFSSAR